MDAITWLENKGSYVDHGYFEEDSETYHQCEGFFEGRLPYRMVRDIQKHAKSCDGYLYRDCGETALYNWTEGSRSYAFTTGTYKSTVQDVMFSWCQTNVIEKEKISQYTPQKLLPF